MFENVLSIRRLNEGIDERRNQLIHEYITGRDPEKTNTLAGLDDYERWRKSADLRKKSLTQSAFIRKNLMGNVQERSNGESALAYFVEKMQDGALYLLDEPENSLSPQNQLQLKYFIEDAVRNHSCQFIVSTHSPFILSLRRAKIYDLDTVPPMSRRGRSLRACALIMISSRNTAWILRSRLNFHFFTELLAKFTPLLYNNFS